MTEPTLVDCDDHALMCCVIGDVVNADRASAVVGDASTASSSRCIDRVGEVVTWLTLGQAAKLARE